MPTYEYLCKNCGHSFEEFQPMSDEPLTRCPTCGADSLARVMGTGGGIIFKGSGFYTTDYRKTGASGAADAGKRETEKKETAKKNAEGKEPEKKEPEKKGAETKQETGKNAEGKGTPGSQPSSPPPPSGPPEKKD
jgi:putative FmdB family regulatory protein